MQRLQRASVSALMLCMFALWPTTPTAAEDATAAGAKPAGIQACGLLTRAEIKTIAARHFLPIFDQIPDDLTELPGGGSECTQGAVQVQLDAAPVSNFEARRELYGDRTKFEPITEVGDQAYFYEQDPGGDGHTVGVYSRVGTHLIVISMSPTPTDSAEALRPVVIALTKAAITKLR